MWGGGAHYTAPLLRAAGGGRRTGGGAARAGPCVTNRSGLIYWGGGGIGGWFSAVKRETVMTEGRGLLGRAAEEMAGAASACQNEGYDMCSPCDPG